MLRYLVALARSDHPLRSRQLAAARLVSIVVLVELIGFLLDLTADPRRALAGDFAPSVVEVVVYVALVLMVAPSLVLYSRQRWQRERYLSKRIAEGHLVASVYLGPELVRLIEDQQEVPLNPYTESVSVVTKPSEIELWAGGLSPTKLATIELSAILFVRLLEDASKFPRPEIRTSAQTLPLYAAVGVMGISRRSSHRLFDELLCAVRGAGASQ